jgi:hypothetical protein
MPPKTRSRSAVQPVDDDGVGTTTTPTNTPIRSLQTVTTTGGATAISEGERKQHHDVDSNTVVGSGSMITSDTTATSTIGCATGTSDSANTAHAAVDAMRLMQSVTQRMEEREHVSQQRFEALMATVSTMMQAFTMQVQPIGSGTIGAGANPIVAAERQVFIPTVAPLVSTANGNNITITTPSTAECAVGESLQINGTNGSSIAGVAGLHSKGASRDAIAPLAALTMPTTTARDGAANGTSFVMPPSAAAVYTNGNNNNCNLGMGDFIDRSGRQPVSGIMVTPVRYPTTGSSNATNIAPIGVQDAATRVTIGGNGSSNNASMCNPEDVANGRTTTGVAVSPIMTTTTGRSNAPNAASLVSHVSAAGGGADGTYHAGRAVSTSSGATISNSGNTGTYSGNAISTNYWHPTNHHTATAGDTGIGDGGVGMHGGTRPDSIDLTRVDDELGGGDYGATNSGVSGTNHWYHQDGQFQPAGAGSGGVGGVVGDGTMETMTHQQGRTHVNALGRDYHVIGSNGNRMTGSRRRGYQFIGEGIGSNRLGAAGGNGTASAGNGMSTGGTGNDWHNGNPHPRRGIQFQGSSGASVGSGVSGRSAGGGIGKCQGVKGLNTVPVFTPTTGMYSEDLLRWLDRNVPVIKRCYRTDGDNLDDASAIHALRQQMGDADANHVQPFLPPGMVPNGATIDGFVGWLCSKVLTKAGVERLLLRWRRMKQSPHQPVGGYSNTYREVVSWVKMASPTTYQKQMANSVAGTYVASLLPYLHVYLSGLSTLVTVASSMVEDVSTIGTNAHTEVDGISTMDLGQLQSLAQGHEEEMLTLLRSGDYSLRLQLPLLDSHGQPVPSAGTSTSDAVVSGHYPMVTTRLSGENGIATASAARLGYGRGASANTATGAGVGIRSYGARVHAVSTDRELEDQEATSYTDTSAGTGTEIDENAFTDEDATTAVARVGFAARSGERYAVGGSNRVLVCYHCGGSHGINGCPNWAKEYAGTVLAPEHGVYAWLREHYQRSKAFPFERLREMAAARSVGINVVPTSGNSTTSCQQVAVVATAGVTGATAVTNASPTSTMRATLPLVSVNGLVFANALADTGNDGGVLLSEAAVHAVGGMAMIRPTRHQCTSADNSRMVVIGEIPLRSLLIGVGGAKPHSCTIVAGEVALVVRGLADSANIGYRFWVQQQALFQLGPNPSITLDSTDSGCTTVPFAGACTAPNRSTTNGISTVCAMIQQLILTCQ